MYHIHLLVYNAYFLAISLNCGPPSSKGEYANFINLGSVCMASGSAGVLIPNMLTAPLLLSAQALMLQLCLGCTYNQGCCDVIASHRHIAYIELFLGHRTSRNITSQNANFGDIFVIFIPASPMNSQFFSIYIYKKLHQTAEMRIILLL